MHRSTTRPSKSARRSAAAAPPSRTRAQVAISRQSRREAAKQHELEQFGRTYYKYLQLFEDISVSIRQQYTTEEIMAAYDREYEIASAEQKPGPTILTVEEVRHNLAALAARCEMIPKSLDHCIRMGFAASTYIHTMMDHLIGHPSQSYTFKDRCYVLYLANKLFRENNGQPSAPTGLPRLIKLIPDVPTTRGVTPADIKRWGSKPDDLTRKAFISEEILRRVFFVVDYAVKRHRGPCYDVQFEDTGTEELTFTAKQLLEMVANAELVTNMDS
ncbi:hypothetical protein Hypma_005551 [Hypsizygus marmoreus]|uniref:Uncharacterized protein n=1 Tax=Hypsizygus marmoreus TaxID=39966 RepID=A0A369JZJ3_HYPMA|nr:hypothetical protein Hypma_005551 [Hypsizygus marmoreus]